MRLAHWLVNSMVYGRVIRSYLYLERIFMGFEEQLTTAGPTLYVYIYIFVGSSYLVSGWLTPVLSGLIPDYVS